MKRILLAIALLLAASAAIAQSLPTLPPSTVFGNMGPAPALGSAVSLPTLQSKIFGIERPVADANYTMVATDRVIAYTSLTAARTVTLLSAASFPPGTVVTLLDRSGSASGTNTITIAPTGADKINGANASTAVIQSARGGAQIESDGVQNWTVIQNPLGGTNTFTGDVYFKSGAPWVDVKAFGATGNGSTDDTTAIQNAINSISGGLGAQVYFPPGVYCTFTGVTVSTAAVHLVGPAAGSNTAVQISTCNHDVTPVTLNAFTAGLRNIQVLGGGITSTHPALVLGSSCTECMVEHSRLQGGTNAIKIQASDFLLFDDHVESAYGAQLIWALGAGYYDRVKADQTYPVSTPSGIIATPSAWQSSHSYAVGNIVSNSGFYIQETAATCTSGTTAPTNQNYGVNIVDNAGGSGTCVWLLVAPTTYYSLNLDTGASVNIIHATDHTGPFTAGIYISNSLSGTAPQSIAITDSVIGGMTTAGIFGHDGNGLMVKGTQISNCLFNGCSGILLGNNWAGDTTISNNLIFSNPLGVDLAAGTNTTIIGNSVFNSSVIGIAVQANITKFSIVSNNAGSSTVWGANAIGIEVLSGTSDYYTIAGNDTRGATTEVSDSGSGTHKQVFANGTSFSIQNASLANPATTVGGQTCTLGSSCEVRQTIGSGTGATLAQNTTNWLSIQGGSSTSNQLIASTVAIGGTIKNLAFNVGTTPAAGQTITATVLTGTFAQAVAGTLSASSVTCTVSNPAVQCQDTTHSIAVTAGNVFIIQAVTSATTGTITGVSWGAEFDNP